MGTIERDSPVPLYHQLKTLIREQIESGLWRPGDRIPTEEELCRIYGISRSPVRQALKELVYEGVLVRRPGAGTFVSESPPHRVVPNLSIQLICSDPRWSELMAHIRQAWNAAHPSQPISFQVKVVSHSRLYDLLSAAIGSGTAPDAAMVDSVWVAGLARAGFLYSLEELDTRWKPSRYSQDLYPAFVRANSYQGKLYGLPVKADISLLWYRKDWLTQEGLLPPQDWDELLRVARHFLRPEVQEQYRYAYPLVFPGGGAGAETTVYTLMPFVWSAGGEVFEDGEVALDSPATRRALHFLRDLVVTHHVAPADVIRYREDTALRLFATGKAVMALGGSYEADRMHEISGWDPEEFQQRVGYTLPPSAPGEQPAPTIGGTSYVILRQSSQPQEVIKVLRFATDPAQVGVYYRDRLQILPNPSFNHLVSPETAPFLAWVAEHISLGRARPSIPEYVKVSRQLQVMFEKTFSDPIPIEVLTRRTAEFISVICDAPCRM
ncbi:MAG: extracellular solute-binding protein [Anaerolineae bacterium]|nr:extracellular solute-binding protein [Anaerolineae bacterium]MDW8067495.1 extracellular solute-binding protein [Anaerolineae bacterium]